MNDQLHPKVTVLLPVYNGGLHLKEAISSILSQDLSDFEFLIINDGSTDNSPETINSFKDPRIRVINNETNLGLIKTLNNGIDSARGDYIVRMDSDDISLRQRLRKQVSFMDANPEVGICGTWVRTFGKKRETWKYPVTHDEIKASLLFRTCFAHSSVIMRTAMLKEHGLYYDENFIYAEDFELWQRCATLFRLANIPEVLQMYRVSGSSITLRNQALLEKTLLNIKIKGYRRIGITDEDLLNNIYSGRKYLSELSPLLLAAKNSSKAKAYCSGENLDRSIQLEWFEINNKSTRFGLRTLKTYLESPLGTLKYLSLKQILKFIFKCIIRYSNKFVPVRSGGQCL